MLHDHDKECVIGIPDTTKRLIMDEQNIEERGLRVPHFHTTWLFATPAGLVQILFVGNNNIKTRYIHACCHAYWPIFSFIVSKEHPLCRWFKKGTRLYWKPVGYRRVKDDFAVGESPFIRLQWLAFEVNWTPQKKRQTFQLNFLHRCQLLRSQEGFCRNMWSQRRFSPKRPVFSLKLDPNGFLKFKFQKCSQD